MPDKRPRHPSSIRQLILALAVAGLAAANPWTVEAQQRSLNLSFLGSNLSSDIPDLQTEGSENSNRLSPDPLDTPLENFKYKNGPVLAAAAEPQKPAAKPAAGGKGAGDDDLAATVTNPIGNLIQF